MAKYKIGMLFFLRKLVIKSYIDSSNVTKPYNLDLPCLIVGTKKTQNLQKLIEQK
jgi:hypothetical protein